MQRHRPEDGLAAAEGWPLPDGETLAWWRCSARNALFSDLTPRHVMERVGQIAREALDEPFEPFLAL
jgi:hypothetical protein